MGTMTAPPSGAYKIVNVPELYGDLIRAKGGRRHLRRLVRGRKPMGAVR